MLEYAQLALKMCEGRSRADLDADRMFQLAVIRALEVIGEAASHIPAEDRAGFPEVPWSVIIRFRNRLIHGYGSVDCDIVWQVATQDLLALTTDLERIVAALPPEHTNGEP